MTRAELSIDWPGVRENSRQNRSLMAGAVLSGDFYFEANEN